MTEAAFHNAETVDMALGCSTNTMLHLPAIAHECGIELSFDMANEISARPPTCATWPPPGDTYMEDLERAGGVCRHGRAGQKRACWTPASSPAPARPWRRTWRAWSTGTRRSSAPSRLPIPKTGGIAVLKGNLAPDGCVVKQSAVAPEMMVHEGPARVFDSEEDAIQAIYAGKDRGRRRGGHPLRGPQGRPRHAGDAQPHLRHRGHGPG